MLVLLAGEAVKVSEPERGEYQFSELNRGIFLNFIQLVIIRDSYLFVRTIIDIFTFTYDNRYFY